MVYCTVTVAGVGMDDGWVWVPRGEGRASGAQGERGQSDAQHCPALYHTLPLTPFFHLAMLLLLGATLVHFLCVALLGRLPRFAGGLLLAAYAVFLWKGLKG